MQRGDLDQSLDFFQQSLEISRELGSPQISANLLLNRAIVYQLKGQHDKSMQDYQQSLIIYEDIDNEPSIAVVLYHLIRLLLEMNEYSLTRNYLQKLHDIHSRSDNRVIDHRYLIAKALFQNTSKRARDKLKAQELFEQVLKEEVADHSLTVTAMIHLAHLLLLELKMTGEDEVLQEVKDLTQQLFDIVESQNSHSLLIETLMLQSKFATMEFKVDQAKNLLTKAQDLATDRDLQILARSVEKEREQLQTQLDTWERLVEGKPTQREIIETTLSEELLDRMIKKTVAALSEEDKRILGEEVPTPKYQLVRLDFLEDSQKFERNQFRLGLAQIGLSETGNILQELYDETGPGLF
jgi:hypothetical protein